MEKMYVVYSKENCPQCEQAIALLKKQMKDVVVKKVGVDVTREDLLKIVPAARSVPQIIFGDEVFGSLKELQDHLAQS